MANFASIEIAQRNCQIHNCDKIAKYDFNGTGEFRIVRYPNRGWKLKSFRYVWNIIKY